MLGVAMADEGMLVFKLLFAVHVKPFVAPRGVKVAEPPIHITVGFAAIENVGAGATVTVTAVRIVLEPQLDSSI